MILIGGMYFCRGCLLAGIGLLFSATFWPCWSFGWVDEVTAGLVFYAILALQVASRLKQGRWLSALARFALGWLLGAAFQIFLLTDHNWVRATILGHYLLGRCFFPGLLRH